MSRYDRFFRLPAMAMVRMKITMSDIMRERGRDRDIYTMLDHPTHKIEMWNGVRAWSCYKEPETVAWIEGMDKKDILYDIGACVGAYALLASKYCHKVYAFEPAPQNLHPLASNILRNKATNVILSSFALMDHDGDMPMDFSSLDEGSADHRWENADQKSHLVRTARLDTLIDSGWPVPTHMKIDVDGVEKRVLSGAIETLSDKKLKSILIEVPADHSHIDKMMSASGFSIRSEHKRESLSNVIYEKEE